MDRAVVSGVTTEPRPHRRLLGPQAWPTTVQPRSRRPVEAQARSLGLPAVETVPSVLPAATGRIVPGVGHGGNVEAPDRFTATVRAWIEDSPCRHRDPARRPPVDLLTGGVPG
ncbi:alpha/beta fold hydrolase [Geodermatophilus sp. SYSU D00742]